MAFGTCRCPWRVQDHISTRFLGSTPSKLLSLFFDDQDKLASAQALPPGSLNIPAAVLIDLKAPPKSYTNKNIQDII